MNIEEALREIGRHEPCPHHSLNKNLGNGKVWAECNDCGQTIAQASIEALRAEHERFVEAMTVLSESVQV